MAFSKRVFTYLLVAALALSATAAPVTKGAPPKKPTTAAAKPATGKPVAPKGGAATTCALPGKGGKAKRGCSSSTEAVVAPNTITLGTKTYTLGPKLGSGANGIAYALTGADAANIAKHYKADSFVNPTTFMPSGSTMATEFAAEVAHTKAVGKLIASGESKIGGAGDALSWIVTHKVAGGPLTETAHYKTTAKAGVAGCKKYLDDIHADFIKHMEALVTKSTLVHLDASDRNVFWNTDGKTFSDFIDFGAMGKVGSDAYKKAARAEGLPETATLKEYAAKRASLNYPIPAGCV